MRLLFYIVTGLLLIGGAQAGTAQTTAAITGRVVDAVTEAPLEKANVFLAHTTRGSATKADGRFAIEHISLNTYEIVVSMVGYETQTQAIHVLDAMTYQMTFSLQPKVVESDLVEVVALSPETWQAHLDLFKRYFLGTSPNAKDCEILNPEVLDFQITATKKDFRASAEEPLRIRNAGLGYDITFVLQDFYYQEQGREFATGYLGQPLFTPLAPANNREDRRWTNRRKTAYRGSLRHFLVALNANQLRDAGFAVYDAGSGRPVNAQRLLLKDPERPHRALHLFEKLRLVYRYESDGWRDEQISELILREPQAIFNIEGHLYNPYALFVSGYLSKEKVAELLPWDYTPNGT